MTKKYPDNFADYPLSIAEQRANDADNASLWTPRDALLSTLRDIDNGTLPSVEVLFLALGSMTENDTKTTFRVAGANHYVIAGVVHRAMFMFNKD